MQGIRRIGWCGLLGAALLAGCGGDDDSSSGTGTGGTSTVSGSGGTSTPAGSGGTTSAGTGGKTSSGSGGTTSTGSGGTTSSGSGGGTSMSNDAGGVVDSGAGDSGGALDASTGGGAFTIESKAFADGSMIDMKYRCTGPSPDLKWSGAPAATLSYAIVFKDISTTTGTGGTMHWLIYDIPKSVMSLSEGVMAGYMPDPPKGAKQGPNYMPANGFAGPCYPVPGATGTYELTLYAIDVAELPGLMMSSAAMDVTDAIMAHTLASVKLTIMSTP